ncbi:hypothetical protein [Segetibacter aerophilus]|uniref:Uncharacterized protein n=1 Tax=Segetibacter aerophilus TaxID=670293 RepID=A0A512BJJ7_9BACT|nr:hypothetical protein [Segetibacter aerophilus]GEO12142.1 hypothetical protein SAE01_46380 [Segetibacter aerophilus]
MTIEQYNNLPDRQKKELLMDASKIDEHEDEISTYEFFRIEDFYVEVSRSVTYKYRRILNTYSLKDIPLNYAGRVAANVIENDLNKQNHCIYL